MAKKTFFDNYPVDKQELLKDYYHCLESREVSIMGRKEVFMGKAKFGIFGGGKELAQIILSKFCKPGDWRSGYYRDQTLMFTLGETTPQQLFAQLYAHCDVEKEPVSAGRLMTGHFGTRMVEKNGTWRELSKIFNSTTDISPTAAQMPRLVGMGYASKLFRENPDLQVYKNLSDNGNEVVWGTIGNASTSEGHFFEAMNACGVLQIPAVVCVWDDDYGISVPSELQTTKGNISAAMAGFQRTKDEKGIEILTARGWNYEELYETYTKANKISREEHVPVLIHVKEMTQPGGHSTSGSHERYKSKERLEWEAEYDPIKQFKTWLLEKAHITESELKEVEDQAKKDIKAARNNAWREFCDSIYDEMDELDNLLERVQGESVQTDTIEEIRKEMRKDVYPMRSEIFKAAKYTLRVTIREELPSRHDLLKWYETHKELNHDRYSSRLYNGYDDSVLNVPEVFPKYSAESKSVDGRQVLQACFDAALARDPRIFAFGEDVGKIGDVNQGFAGLQEKHGELRVTDTGIRESTIIGQAIGAAQRGLKPIAEIQYVDYILYAIQTLSDDLATLHYRSFGQQKAPVIVRTRGHRLEGVWHSGSPMGTILHSIRGVYVCTPRNMTQAAGMYNSLLKSDDPGVVIECLNAYRLKERLPDNIGEFTVPLGKCEVLREGSDFTIVTYGSMCRICLDGAEQLQSMGISAEVIDVQTLIPFDLDHTILESIKKTNRVLFADEDVPGGATAYMMQQVLEKQGGYYHLDSLPKTIHSYAHRPAYASDGDYFSKPNAEDVFDYVYELMHEVDPAKYPMLY